MFTNVTIYRIAPGWAPALDAMNDALTRFVPCGSTQDRSVGWIEPRGEEHGPMVESVAGQRIAKLMIETKSVPGSVIKAHAAEAADQIEATTGRKPGKKETRALREDALLALLPQAFPKLSSVWVWFGTDFLVVDASSQRALDEVVTALVRAFDGLVLTQVQTSVTPQTAMTQWLSATTPDEWPGDFSVERECELKSGDEDKAVVKYNRHNLNTDEVRQHITEGKLPTRLAMSYDGKLSFVLTETMRLKKVKFLDVQTETDDSGFDADVALTTGELGKLIPALIDALGGENLF